jgi:hypothetical protein
MNNLSCFLVFLAFCFCSKPKISHFANCMRNVDCFSSEVIVFKSNKEESKDLFTIKCGKLFSECYDSKLINDASELAFIIEEAKNNFETSRLWSNLEIFERHLYIDSLSRHPIESYVKTSGWLESRYHNLDTLSTLMYLAQQEGKLFVFGDLSGEYELLDSMQMDLRVKQCQKMKLLGQ